ncbi:MAG: aminotransferase class V-fold PLP-dependent enzyme, partial [Alphaproteobacteria bacterium]|nr:aminotransferase class V-fold PLP-dependent enzyme [Alphaproteobacteria bacterium]
MYGPKGIGALYVRRRPRVRLEPLMSGGGQERGLRSGTLPAFLCVGFGAACTIARGVMNDERDRLTDFAERLKNHLLAVPGAHLNGDRVHRWPGNLNVAFPGIDAEALLVALDDDIAASTGSACTSASVEPSYVLGALGLDTASAAGSIRIGLGRQTTREEVDFIGARIVAVARKLGANLEVSAA